MLTIPFVFYCHPPGRHGNKRLPADAHQPITMFCGICNGYADCAHVRAHRAVQFRGGSRKLPCSRDVGCRRRHDRHKDPRVQRALEHCGGTPLRHERETHD